jgi:hypothetical protein
MTLAAPDIPSTAALRRELWAVANRLDVAKDRQDRNGCAIAIASLASEVRFLCWRAYSSDDAEATPPLRREILGKLERLQVLLGTH